MKTQTIIHKPKHFRANRTQARQGTAAVEMAFILPVFFLMVFGCMEFSRISMIRNLTANAAYEAARYSMVQGASSNDATQVANEVLGRLGLSGGVIVVKFKDESGATVAPSAGKTVNVKVDVPYGQNGFLAGFLPGDFANLTLTSQVTLRTNKHSDEDNW